MYCVFNGNSIYKRIAPYLGLKIYWKYHRKTVTTLKLIISRFLWFPVKVFF